MQKFFFSAFLFFVVLNLLSSEEKMLCPKCNGQGSYSCQDCDKTTALCPNRCIKKDKYNTSPVLHEGWMHAQVIDQYGNVHYTQCSETHTGEIWNYENGIGIGQGKCPTCHGTGKAQCRACRGKKTLACDLCEGKKEVAKKQGEEYLRRQKEAQQKAQAKAEKAKAEREKAQAKIAKEKAEAQAEKEKKQAQEIKTIKLKNGQVLQGKKVVETQDKIGIKTAAGKLIVVDKKDIAE